MRCALFCKTGGGMGGSSSHPIPQVLLEGGSHRATRNPILYPPPPRRILHNRHGHFPSKPFPTNRLRTVSVTWGVPLVHPNSPSENQNGTTHPARTKTIHNSSNLGLRGRQSPGDCLSSTLRRVRASASKSAGTVSGMGREKGSGDWRLRGVSFRFFFSNPSLGILGL